MVRKKDKRENIKFSLDEDEKIIEIDTEQADVVGIVVHNRRTGKTSRGKLNITKRNKIFLN